MADLHQPTTAPEEAELLYVLRKIDSECACTLRRILFHRDKLGLALEAAVPFMSSEGAVTVNRVLLGCDLESKLVTFLVTLDIDQWTHVPAGGVSEEVLSLARERGFVRTAPSRDGRDGIAVWVTPLKAHEVCRLKLERR
jgi:hypothetical protein